MPYICRNPEAYVGQKVGSGQCVAFVQQCAGAPVTSMWTKGQAVKGNTDISVGTAIATFDENGRYPNQSHGNHAAIYVGQDVLGIWVYDQWTKQLVHKRRIAFKGGVDSPSNDGDAFSVIE